ncbi:hypothetical protein ABVK25_003837 [Lepraria finkii]|uniref:COP9 signalosome complex subunit 6 n=1 Tax=Lepraria finkii TaxID=1340010 RepID=A0ABR4BCQ9_9LECA
MASTAPNSLLSTHKSSDSSLNIHLHPLILLTISDYITRHTLRRYQTPIVGALLGQQNGRDITLEHAFECDLIQNNDQIQLHETWFKDRLQQYKDVHLAPALELMGWFTTTAVTGPEGIHVPIHQQILQQNETAVLLAFHPSSVLEGAAVGGKLPLTIYESVYESGEAGDRSMEIDGQDSPLDLRFRELPYSVETGEAEMISVDFVARSGGNATAVDGTVKKNEKAQASQAPVGQVDEKGKATAKETKAAEDSSILSAEDEELVASLTARANAVKMLHIRIRLLKSYLNSLPLSYLTTPAPPISDADSTSAPHTDTSTSTPEINHPLLRSILAILSCLPLLLPPAHLSNFHQETLAEKSDVELISLLGSLGRSVKDAREMGRKFGVVENVKSQGKKGYINMGALGEDMWDGEGKDVGSITLTRGEDGWVYE